MQQRVLKFKQNENIFHKTKLKSKISDSETESLIESDIEDTD